MNSIRLDIPVEKVLQQNPELLNILVEFGFTLLENPLMRATVAKITTLEQGCQMIGKLQQDLIQTLEWNGYQVEE